MIFVKVSVGIAGVLLAAHACLLLQPSPIYALSHCTKILGAVQEVNLSLGENVGKKGNLVDEQIIPVYGAQRSRLIENKTDYSGTSYAIMT